jgi:hypothetical protein
MDQETIERIRALINLEMPDGSWLLIWTGEKQPDGPAQASSPLPIGYIGNDISPITALRMVNGVAKQIEGGHANFS